MIYELTPTGLPVDETFSVALDDATIAETEKVTVADLLAPADTRREDADDDIISGCGTDADGIYTPDDTTHNIRTADFVDAGLDANLFNADKLLDTRINSLALLQPKYEFVTLTAAQVKAALATPVEVLPAPAAGTFNLIKRVICKLRFNTTAYTLPGAGEFYFYYDSIGKEIIEIASGFFSLGADSIYTYYPVDALDHEIESAGAIYLTSGFGGELTLGDSPIDLIIEYINLTDFTVVSTPTTSGTCLQSVTGDFVNADLTASGNLEITHNLNSIKIMSVVVLDNTGTSVAVAYNVGDETGADTLNMLTIATGAIVGTYQYAIIINIC